MLWIPCKYKRTNQNEKRRKIDFEIRQLNFKSILRYQDLTTLSITSRLSSSKEVSMEC